MKFNLVIGLCFLFSTTLFSQQIKVLEQNTQVPIPGVTIYNVKKDKTIITNLDGKASLDLFSDNETLHFQHSLYNRKSFKKSKIANKEYVVYLDFKVEDLDQVVVSASKFKQSKRDIPQRIVNISSKDIQFSNPQTSADLLESTGNVYIQKSQLGGGSPMIRGFSTNRLLIAVDGVRMNNAIFRGGNLQNVISIDPFAIKNTEITLGAGSVVYGSDAIGGVMSFYTQKPQLSYKDSLYFNANVITRYATANKEKAGHIDFNFGFKKWAFLSSLSYTDFDDLRMGSHGPDDYLRLEYVQTINGIDTTAPNNNPLVQQPTGYNQINLIQKIRFEPKDNLSFDLGLYYSTTSDYARYDRLIRYRNDMLRSAEWNYGPQRWVMGNFQVTKLSSSSNVYDKIQATVAYQNFQESRMDRDFQSPIRNVREEAVDALSLNVDFEKQLTPKTELFYGVEYVYNKVNSEGFETNITTNTTTQAVSRYPNGSDWQSMAAYSSIKFKPNSKFIFQSGLRYNHIVAHADFTENNQFLNLPFNTTTVDAGALTGTAGISWIPNKTMQWKLNASTAFRAPNIDDIGKVFDSEPGSVVVPNKDLKPEYAYGGELGLKLNFDDTFIVDMATYYTFLDNALVRRDFTLNGETEIMYDGELSNIQAIQNASKSWIYGFELGVELKLTNQIKLTSQYNIIGGTEEDNGIEVPVRHIAPNFGNTHLAWQNEKFLIDAFAEYNNELSFNQLSPSVASYLFAQDKNGNPYSPSWYTLNLRAQYKISKAATCIASLENITDQRYKTYSSGIAAAGRNLILSLKYSL
ncbi:TonB-dependent receptor [Ichthyenterobacterium magnum]|uniref:Hemoglobin/transferrin/lactoferrin receptor protein n=1 Tax=Ichthyenterobacterium magnum TaxID=1230530 RepID=A0A420DXN2_9FLAO|nr:TonB-dependent receptor [Ichthyenterobacterium magnum]RKE99002.1 hemoglobin/transferrin/lactoferrin receptor protein [Ichthyenterobacterium magnum]